MTLLQIIIKENIDLDDKTKEIFSNIKPSCSKITTLDEVKDLLNNYNRLSYIGCTDNETKCNQIYAITRAIYFCSLALEQYNNNKNSEYTKMTLKTKITSLIKKTDEYIIKYNISADKDILIEMISQNYVNYVYFINYTDIIAPGLYSNIIKLDKINDRLSSISTTEQNDSIAKLQIIDCYLYCLYIKKVISNAITILEKDRTHPDKLQLAKQTQKKVLAILSEIEKKYPFLLNEVSLVTLNNKNLKHYFKHFVTNYLEAYKYKN